MKISHKARRFNAPHPHVAALIADILATPSDQLAFFFSRIDTWKWSRSDLNAWVKVLNRLDTIMEDIIREFELDQLQSKDFTPHAKETLLQILKFERLLLENSTNRKMFNSYDRLNSLLFTSDLDVLIAALFLLLRPSQQYSSQPASSHSQHISPARLECLSKPWTHVREHGIEMIDLVSAKGKEKLRALPQEASEVFYTFYWRTDEGTEKPATEQSGTPTKTPTRVNSQSHGSSAQNVHLGPLAFSSRPTFEILRDVIKSHHVPDSEKFELMCRIRTAQALDPNKDEDRQKLVVVRLLATAVYALTHLETQAQSTLFLYDGDLVNHTAELLQLEYNIPVIIQTASLAALDAFSRSKGKVLEVLAAVNAGVNHGILMSLLRKTVHDISYEDSDLPHIFVDALLSLIMCIASHAIGGNMVVGAGLIPLLIQIISIKVPQRLAVVSKTMQLLDSLLYSFPNAVTIFCNGQGVEALTARIEYEVNLSIEELRHDETARYCGGAHGLLQFSRSGTLKHLLKTMHRLMQSSGTSEGMRGLIDSPLLKSAERIVEYRGIFGPAILPFAFNIVASFVHNEPTSLATIQEAKVPETIFAALEAGLEPSIEVIQAIPNVLGALCLNQTGQEQLASHPSIIPTLFSIFTSERHVKVLQEKENAAVIGAAIDELIRHHPSLKRAVFDSLVSTLRKILDLGSTYVPPDDIRQWYLLSRTPQEPQDVVMDDTEAAEAGGAASGEISAPRAVGHPPEDNVEDDQASQKPHDNIVVTFIDVMGRFLEGLFQHTSHCKDFIELPKGLECLAELNTLPCLPYDFGVAVQSDPLVQVTRTLIEVAPAETLGFLSKQLKESLEETKDFWQPSDRNSPLLSMVEITNEVDLQRANSEFRRLVTLLFRVGLMSDVYTGIVYMQNRVLENVLTNLTSSGIMDILPKLGALHRRCTWENAVLKSGLAEKGIQISSSPAGESSPSEDGRVPPRATPAMENGDVLSLAEEHIFSGDAAAKEGRPQTKVGSLHANAKAVKHLATHIPNALAPFFQSTAKMLVPMRRNPEPLSKDYLTTVSSALAEIMVNHLKEIPAAPTENSILYAYFTLSLGLVTVLLFDERSPHTSYNSLLLFQFRRAGGIDSLLEICHKFTSAIHRISEIKPSERNETDKQEMVHVFGGLKIALHLLYLLSSFRPSADAGTIVKLVQGDKPEKHPDYFEPHDFLVQLRLSIAPLIVEIWCSSWLVNAPPALTKYVIQTAHEILAGDNEKPANDARLESITSAPVASVIRPLVPDEDRVVQLMDMGFPRAAAERALSRSHNNINVATEYLLLHPFLVNESEATGESTANAEESRDEQPTSSGDVPTAEESVPNAMEIQPTAADDHTVSGPSEEILTAPSPEERRAELDLFRASLANNIGSLSLRLVDTHPSLIFDVRSTIIGSALAHQSEAIRTIIQDIERFSPSAYDVQEQPLAVRCRLLALLLVDVPETVLQITQNDEKGLMEILLALLLSHPVGVEKDQVLPKWLAALMLALESLVVAADSPRAITLPLPDEAVEPKELLTGPDYSDCKQILFDLCIRLLEMTQLPRDELIATLRLLIVLTRDSAFAASFIKKQGLQLLLGRVRGPYEDSGAYGVQSHVVIILRHLAEDKTILGSAMAQEIKRFFGPRNRSIDVSTLVKNLAAMASRDSQVFIDVTKSLCRLSSIDSPLVQITLKTTEEDNNSKPIDADVGEDSGAGATQEDMQVDTQTQTTQHVEGQNADILETTVHFLLSELMRVGKVACESIKQEEAAAPGTGNPLQAPLHNQPSSTEEIPAQPSEESQSDSENRSDSHFYACFLMQCLTELLFSYEQCKTAFLSYPKKPSQRHTPGKDSGIRFKSTALNYLLQELVSFGAFNMEPKFDARKRIMLCNWAMSTIVALCVDSQGETRSSPTTLSAVRRTVLEAINKSFKEVPPSEPVDVRYGRLLALADLCHKLLVTRVSPGSSKAPDVIATEIAKIMLEKSFVGTLTGILSEVDLNYPNMQSLVTAILRPLEYLSKVAIKVGRVSERAKDVVDRESDTSDPDMPDDEDEDMEEDIEREETPDLYRNSSLGMFGAEMEDLTYDEDEVMAEDEDEDEDGDIEFDEESDSEGSSVTDEDENDEVDRNAEDWMVPDEEMDEDDASLEGEETDESAEEEDIEEADGDDLMWQDVSEPLDEDREAFIVDEDEVDDDNLQDDDQREDEDEREIFTLPEFINRMGDLENVGQGVNDEDEGVSGIPRIGIRSRVLLADGHRDADEMHVFGRSRAPVSNADNLAHPLLVDAANPGSSSGQARSSHRRPRSGGILTSSTYTDMLQSIEEIVGEGAAHLVQQLVSRTVPAGADIRVEVPASVGFVGGSDRIARHGRAGVTAAVRLRGVGAAEGRSSPNGLVPLSTFQRWTEEARILHGKHLTDRMGRLSNHIVLAMLPEARDAQKKAREKEEKERKEREEAAATSAPTNAVQRPTDQDAMTGETSQEGVAEATAPQESLSQPSELQQDLSDEQVAAVPAPVMEMDAEMTEALPVQSEEAHPEMVPAVSGPSTEGSNVPEDETMNTEPSADADAEPTTSTAVSDRVTVMVHGNAVDITGTGIDPTFLEALPDDMREEVLNQHFRERRAAQVEPPTESQISPEFLDALPPEIRAELLQQERVERARRDAQHPGTEVVDAAAGPTEMDAASFIASLDPILRQAVLMDSDEGFLQTLPSHMLAEAGAYREPPRITHLMRQDNAAERPQGAQAPRKPVVKDAVQLLDRPGIATLVRLLFFPHLSKKNTLHKILLNLCENSKSRTDLFNLLLGILQDGSGDLATVDKNFSQLSFYRTKSLTAPSKGKQKDFAPNLPHVPTDIPADLIAQRCLDALTYIVGSNELSSLFFLTEHELPAGMKKASSRKGKGKEKQAAQTYYPVVLLLNLLDRQTLLKTPSIMDSVAGLLNAVTRPLVALKGDKEKQPSVATPEVAAVPTQGSTASAPAEGATVAPDTNPAPSSQPPATTVSEDAKAPESVESMEEKLLVANPPQIPHPALRLIVNILTVGDCSARTFQHTLALIQHLSFLPDARDVIAQELKAKAQEFGLNLCNDLDQMITALDGPTSDLPSALTAKFSSASSDQAKLLRVLKTIDYMFSKPASNTTLPQMAEVPDDDSLRRIYESFHFTTLWKKLSDCLAVVESRSDVEHIATILLPLIESLMVVCKNVGLKGNAPPRPAVTPASPGAQLGTENMIDELFVKFTDDHRKVLNLMVRNNPSLMSGSFSLLVQNPRVLDFDNKRNYFSQQLHRRPHPHHGTVQVNVRRARVFEDSYHAFQHKSGEQIKYGKLSVRFYGEEGVDAGGVTREWFQILARQMFDPNYALFEPCAADSQTYQPNRNSAVNPDHLSYFKFVGRVIGKAIFDGRLMDAHFARSLYRQLLGKRVDYRDLEMVDPEYYKSLCWILENDPSVLDLTFITEVDVFGEHAIIPLKENGASIPVTQENKKEYVQLSAQYRLYSSIKDQIENLLAGFYEIIPKELISIFNEQEVELLISGTPDIDVDEWRAATEYNGYSSSDPVIVWWWRALKSFNRDERAKVLSFATGTSRVPLGGFVELQGVQGTQRFSIHKAYGEPDRLPQAHTCFNQIDLPQYTSYEKLRQQLLLAINEGGEGFGFA